MQYYEYHNMLINYVDIKNNFLFNIIYLTDKKFKKSSLYIYHILYFFNIYFEN